MKSLISIRTPGKGVTLLSVPLVSSGYFNPHTREGCDLNQFVSSLEFSPISIHTPGKGVTPVYVAESPMKRFQSTHPGRV